MLKILFDKDFIKWLEDNEIIYDKKDESLIKALYSEYFIEKNSIGNLINKIKE